MEKSDKAIQTASIASLVTDFQKENPQKGYLSFQVTTGKGAYPVPKAKITVSRHVGGDYYVSKVIYTDENGKTEPLELPAPSKSLSQTPGNATPFSVYNARIEAPGYVTTDMYQVPVFEDITSLQPVNLVPYIASKNNIADHRVVFSAPQDL